MCILKLAAEKEKQGSRLQAGLHPACKRDASPGTLSLMNPTPADDQAASLDAKETASNSRMVEPEMDMQAIFWTPPDHKS